MIDTEIDIWVDGGCIGRNPSPIGGTFAWVHVLNGGRVRCGSGVITPTSLNCAAVSNNVAELYAAYAGLLSAPPGWRGLLWTDSMVTYHRLTGGQKWAGVPAALMNEVRRLISARGVMPCDKRWTPMHCGGHPTREDLAVGYDNRGLKVSIWNVFCDRRCGVESKRYLRRLRRENTSARRPGADGDPG